MQVDGAAMGSPLLPIVANIYMEAFEDKALEEFPVRPRMWLRYVDDTPVVWEHGQEQLERFQEHLNNQNESIQFTKEEESEGVISFLDVRVKRN